MAIMIPETIPSTSYQGEKRLFNVLRDRLDNTYIAWHNPKIKGLEADFVVLSPVFGLLIIEVKGHRYSDIKKADPKFFTIERKKGGVSVIEREKAPLEQCRGYLINMLDTVKSFPVLCHQSGKYQGKPRLPIGHGAVMSNITTDKATVDNLIQVLTPPQVAFREELLSWEEMDASAIVSRLQQMFTVYFRFDKLTPDQISTIRGILYPEFVAKTEPATSDSVAAEVDLPDSSKIFKTLDIQQERLARSIGEGHRLFSGVAGSGKTIILLARAKYLINRYSKHKVLILCYNVTLAAYLRSLLHEDSLNPQYQKIEVWHFHQWARLILGRLPSSNSPGGDPEGYLGQILDKRISQIEPHRLWDSILIDEAHTFHPEWFRCCVNALKDPEHGSLTIVSDGSQNLYQRTKFTWKSVGISASGRRTRKLSQNYRNTQEILSAAWSVIDAINDGEESVDGKEIEATFPIVKPSAALRNGVKPTLYLASSPQAEIEAMTEQIQALLDKGQKPEDIAVIYRYAGKDSYHEKLLKLLIQTLQQHQILSYWITERGTSRKAKYSTKQPGVRIVTALSSLGLEFQQVIIPWVQQYDSFADNADAVLRNRRQLYVAMTRAQERLCLFGSGRSKIRPQLEQSEHLDLVNL